MPNKKGVKYLVHNAAPSGMVKLYQYKEPFMKNPEPFHGFQGVLLHDSQDDVVQCSECGEWLTAIGGAHLKKRGLDARRYKKKFGLKQSTALINETLRAYRIGVGMKGSLNAEGVKPSHFKKGEDVRRIKRDYGIPMESRNEYGTCPEQILDKLRKLHDKLGRQPSYNEFNKTIPGIREAVKLTFGSWGNACRVLGWKVQKPGYSFGQFVWDKNKLLDILKIFKEKNDREPMYSDMKRGLIPGRSVFRTHFGGFKIAKEIAYSN